MLSDIFIVFGYPKAGNTGLARLIRTAFGGQTCNFPGEENWIDLADRGNGKVKIYKTHTPERISDEFMTVYILRDPIAMSISGFYHNKPWLKGTSIMNTFLGDLFINIYLFFYGCNWPGLPMYKDHYKVALKHNALVLRYEDLWIGNIEAKLRDVLFLSQENYEKALKIEAKEIKKMNFSNSGDKQSVAFLKEYNRDVKINRLVLKILKYRSGRIWNIYYD